MCKVSKTSIIATACLLAFSSSSALTQTIWDSNQLPQSIIKEPKKEKLYTVYFNPFSAQEESEKMVAKKYSGKNLNPEEWEFIFSKEMEAHEKSPGRLVVASRILADLSKSLMNRNVYIHNIVSAITLPLNETEKIKIEKMEDVTLINEIDEIPYSTSFPYQDHQSDGELVSWAKKATNTDDNYTTDNPFYFLDLFPGNLQSTSEYHINIIHYAGNDYSQAFYHPSAIAQIVSGRRNGSHGRGINPNQPLFLAVGGVRAAAQGLEAAVHHADSRKISSVLNISSNIPEGSGPYWHYYTNPHREDGKMILRASNRFLITQSASNMTFNNSIHSACPFVYNVDGNVVDNDAILSIGAVNHEGKRMVNSGAVATTRVGPCVDFYAPGDSIYAYADNPDSTHDSGTSFSAPIVAAIASRYGDKKTKPLVRESYIKSLLVPTGHTDPLDGKPIKIPRYNPYSFGILKNHPILYAVSPINNQKINYIKDDNFFQRPDEFWHASGNTGSLTLDLGSIKNVTGIRVVLETSSPGMNPVHFTIYGSSAPMTGSSYTYDEHKPTSFIKDHTASFQYERAPIYIPLNGNYRSIRIDGNNPTSWFAVVEIEVYGY
ncbi:S8 family serine peptidase [Allofranklinella schreckenbergeri]|nr:S8 family serine peptidase [Allofranklinella schreckenbergeri]